MTVLTGPDQSKIAFFYRNVLALQDGRVIGVHLGHCVFGKNGQVRAKYFRHTLYALDGRILAKETASVAQGSLDEASLLQEAWKIIGTIRDHSCPVVDPREEWMGGSLVEHFLVQ